MIRDGKSLEKTLDALQKVMIDFAIVAITDAIRRNVKVKLETLDLKPKPKTTHPTNPKSSRLS